MAPTENVRKSSNMTEGKKKLQSDYKQKGCDLTTKEKGYNLTIKERVTI